MDRDRLVKRLMNTFLQEMEEHLRSINQDLLDLEKLPPGEDRSTRLQSLFRSAHSLKGAARSVNATLIEEACHAAEEILAAARAGTTPLDAERIALLFEATDAIEEAGMRLREQHDLSDSPLAELLPRLHAVIGGNSGARSASTAVIAAPLPQPRPTVPTPSGASSSPVSSSSQVISSPQAIESSQAMPSSQVLQPSQPSESPAARTLPSDAPIAAAEAPAPAVAAATVPSSSPTKPAAPPAVVPPTGPTSVPHAESPATIASMVRVLPEKLDALLAQSGELLVARRRVRGRIDDLIQLRETLRGWRSEWRSIERLLGRRGECLIWGFPAGETNGSSMTSASSVAFQTSASSALLTGPAYKALTNVGQRLRNLERQLETLTAELLYDCRALDQVASNVDEQVRRVRMIPFAEACAGLDRLVRDVARTLGKEVELVLHGGEVELDRSILERLKDPLRHLIRNAVDHGAWTPSEAARLGRSPITRIEVTAALHGDHVEVHVRDNGRGIHLETLRQIARQRQLPEPADERDLTRLIFLPGFSTAEKVTNVSGRGVGLDVVKSVVESMHGSIGVTSQPNQGTHFLIRVPLTLTTQRVVLIGVSGQTYAVPVVSVVRLMRIEPEQWRTVARRPMLAVDGQPVPVVSLAETLGLNAGPPQPSMPHLALILTTGNRRIAFVVDAFLAEQEIVVKGLGHRLKRLKHLSGASILASGEVVLVLNASGLMDSVLTAPPRVALPTRETQLLKPRKRILLAEDSFTTRTLEKSILEASGYEVLDAPDGQTAWQLLQQKGADLVVSDVDMPLMNGFELTETIRNSSSYRHLPVILLTARENDRDKAHGLAVGANAYLGKSGFDQSQLLQVIGQFL